MSDDDNDGCGCSVAGIGCLGPILFFILLWMLAFGVTIGGVHYYLGLSCDHGVEVHHE